MEDIDFTNYAMLAKVHKSKERNLKLGFSLFGLSPLVKGSLFCCHVGKNQAIMKEHTL